MNLQTTPLHKLCVDKTSCLFSHDDKSLTHLTKDVYRKKFEKKQALKIK